MLYVAFWPIVSLPFFFFDGEFPVVHKMMAVMALLLVPYVHWTSYVVVPGGIKDDALPRVMIPATEVLSWHRTPEPDASAPVSPMPASSAPRGGTGP